MSAISGVDSEVDTEVEKVASAEAVVEYQEDDIEKIASALEWVARQGVESFVKEAMAQQADVTASHVSGDNPAEKPNFGASENKSHHPALASNESAIAYSPEERNKMIDPTLKSLLAHANKDSIHTAKVVAPGKKKMAADTQELLRQAIAAKLAQK